MTEAGAGKIIVLDAFPDTDYWFKEWQVVSGGPITFWTQTGSGDIFEMPSNPVTIRAIFDCAPTVLSVSPTGIGAAVTGNLVITFDSAMDPETVGKVSLDGVTELPAGTWSTTTHDNDTYTTHYSGLSNSTTYTVNIQDFAKVGGPAMAMDNSHTFTTAGSSSSGSVTTYAVTYVDSGDTGSKYTVSGLSKNSKHTVLTASAVNISRVGYQFKGWNTKADGSGTAYAAGSSLTVTQNITLYAQWEKVADKEGMLETDRHLVYVCGYPDGTFKPDNAITRAEVAAIFYRLLKNPSTASNGSFSDVNGDAWYAQAVNSLASMGILTGYPDGSFKPEQQITRGEFATIASQFEHLDASVRNVFSDVPADSWAVSYINSAYAKGWINGYPDGTFKPNNSINRAEVVIIVN